MFEAIHLSVLVCLLTATLCSGSNVSTTTEQRIPTTASTLLTTKTFNGSTPQLRTTAHQVATEAVSTPPRNTLHGNMGETSPSSRTQTTLITTTPNATVSQEHTASPASGTPNVTTNTTLHTTSQVSSPIWIKGDLAANPGLVAIISIFCIILGMTLVVLAVKCIQSPRSNFERLEDVPLGKVNEESPFAHYSK